MENPQDVLYDYILNTIKYRNQFDCIIANYIKKRQKGVYTTELAIKGWLNLVNVAARDYCKTFSGTVRSKFPKNVREDVAVTLEDVTFHEYIMN